MKTEGRLETGDVQVGTKTKLRLRCLQRLGLGILPRGHGTGRGELGKGEDELCVPEEG